MADERVQKARREREEDERQDAKPADLSQKAADLRESSEEVKSAIDEMLEEALVEEQGADPLRCRCGNPIEECHNADVRGVSAWSS